MYLTNENIIFAKKNGSEFISLKYLDSGKQLSQIDSLTQNVLADPNNHGTEISKNLCLLPIPDKGFSDPFRAIPTTSFLCSTTFDDLNVRNYSQRLAYGLPANMVATLEAELTFWIIDDDMQMVKNNYWKCDPFDIYSNLRSDILHTLESINVKTATHRPGNHHEESIISFRGNDIIDLADNFILTKYIINNVAANYGKKVEFTKQNTNNLKLILVCNNNDGKMFSEYYSSNSEFCLDNKDYLQINNLNLKSLKKRKLFNEDCKLEIHLSIENNFVPYLDFAFIVLCFCDNERIVNLLEELEFNKFVVDYKKKMGS